MLYFFGKFFNFDMFPLTFASDQKMTIDTFDDSISTSDLPLILSEEKTFADKANNTLACVAFYNPFGRLTLNQKNILKALTEANCDLLVVNSALKNKKEFLALPELKETRVAVCRRNIGLDITSYILCLTHYSEIVAEYDNVILLNDSITGPLFPLTEIIEPMQHYDYWGLTDSYQHMYHLQSYFVGLSRDLITNSKFQDLIKFYSHGKDKSAVIANGEIGISRFCIDSGVNIGVAYPYDKVAKKWMKKYVTDQHYAALESHRHLTPENRHIESVHSWLSVKESLNPTHHFWDVLIHDFGFPFVKNELYISNPANIPIFNICEEIESMTGEKIASVIEENRQLFTNTNQYQLS